MIKIVSPGIASLGDHDRLRDDERELLREQWGHHEIVIVASTGGPMRAYCDPAPPGVVTTFVRKCWQAQEKALRYARLAEAA